MHLNFEGYFASSAHPPYWLIQLQQDWQPQGVVRWDANLHIVTHLYAGYAVEFPEHLQDNNAWTTKGFVVGSPAHRQFRVAFYCRKNKGG